MNEQPIKILLIEDNPGDVRLIKEFLAEAGGAFFKVESTERLAAGLERLAQEKYDAVLLDLGLPDSQGLDTLKQVSGSCPHIPIVVLTGLADEEITIKAVQEGAQDYLIKGQLDGKLLARSIRYAIERERAEEEIRRQNRHLSVLYTIDHAASQSLELDSILNDAVEATLEALEIEAAGIFLLEDDGETMTFRVHRGLSEEFVKNIKHIKLGEGISGRAAAERKPVVLDVSDYPSERLAPHIIKEGFQTLASTPLISAGEVVGALNLGTCRPRAFPPEELELLTSIGRQLGGAVRNAQLYKEVQQELAERRRTVEALRGSEARYKKLVESVIDYIFTVKVERGQAVETTHGPGCSAVTGYTPEEFEADSTLWYRMVYEEDRAAVRQQADNVLAGKAAPPLEHRIINKNGSILWVRNTPVFRHDEQGQLAAYEGLITDITERKLAEEALAERERLLQMIFDTEPECVKLLAEDGTLLQINRAGLNMAEADSPEQVIGKSFYSVVAPEYQQAFRMLVDSVFGGEPGSMEYELIGLKGTRRWQDAHAVPLRDQKGAIIALLSVTRDTTERKQAEEALETERQRLYSLLDELPGFVILLHPDHSIGFANRYFLEHFGDPKGKRCYEAVWGRQAPCEECPPFRIFETKEPLQWEWRSPDDRIYQIYDYPFTDIDGTQLVMELGIDITEHKSLEAQLLQAQKLEAVGTLAGGIAHDFNNLLTASMGNLELAKSKIKKDKAVIPYLEELEKITRRAAELTNRLLAFSRRHILQPVPLNLNDTLSDMNKVLSRILGEHIEIGLKLGKKLGLLKADPIQMEQVIINLCVNARDAMPEGGKLTLATHNIRLEGNYINNHPWVEKGDYVLLEVTDTGSGMDKATLERIFEPFFTTKEVGKGTGLGLSMVYGIVKQHQGYINVYSEPGRGSTFKIYLPRLMEEVVAEKIKEAPQEVKGGRETILLAEDEEQLREAIRQVLEMFGYTVLAAKDGQEAVELYEQEREKIDLVILDAVMPRMGGMDAADLIYKLNPRQKILFSSGYSADGLHESFIISEKMQFIKKPYTAKTLAQKVREVLES